MSFSYDKFNDTETERREKTWREAQNKANTSSKRGFGSRYRYEVVNKTGKSESIVVNPFVSEGDESFFQPRGRREAIELGTKKPTKSKDDQYKLDSKKSINAVTDFRRVLLGSVPNDFKEQVFETSKTIAQAESPVEEEPESKDVNNRKNAALSLLQDYDDDADSDEDAQMVLPSNHRTSRIETKTSSDSLPVSFGDFKKEFERKYASKLSPPREEVFTEDQHISKNLSENNRDPPMLSASKCMETFRSSKRIDVSHSSTDNNPFTSVIPGIFTSGKRDDKISEREQFLKYKLKQFLGLPSDKDVDPVIFEKMPDEMIATFLKYLTAQQSSENIGRESGQTSSRQEKNVSERNLVTRKRSPDRKESSRVKSKKEHAVEEKRRKKHASPVFDRFASDVDYQNEKQDNYKLPLTSNIHREYTGSFSKERQSDGQFSSNSYSEMQFDDEPLPEERSSEIPAWSREITVERKKDRDRRHKTRDRSSSIERHGKWESRKRRSRERTREGRYQRERSSGDGRKKGKIERNSRHRSDSRERRYESRHRRDSRRDYFSDSSNSDDDFRNLRYQDHRYEQMDLRYQGNKFYSDHKYGYDSKDPWNTEQNNSSQDYYQYGINQVNALNSQIPPSMYQSQEYTAHSNQMYWPYSYQQTQSLQTYQGMYQNTTPYATAYNYTMTSPDQLYSQPHASTQYSDQNLNNTPQTESKKPLSVVLVGHNILQQIKDVIDDHMLSQGSRMHMYPDFGLYRTHVDIHSQECSDLLVEELGSTYMDNIVKNNPDIVLLMIGGNNVDSVTFSSDHLIHEIIQIVSKLVNIFKVKCVVVCELLSKKKPQWISPEEFRSRKASINVQLEEQLSSHASAFYWKHKSVWQKIANESEQAKKGSIIKYFYESIQHALLRAVTHCSKNSNAMCNRSSQDNAMAGSKQNKDFLGKSSSSSSVNQTDSKKDSLDGNVLSSSRERGYLPSTLDEIQHPEVNSSQEGVRLPSTEVRQLTESKNSKLPLNNLYGQTGSEFVSTSSTLSIVNKDLKTTKYIVTIVGHQLADYLEEGLLNGLEFGMLSNFGFDHLKIDIIGRTRCPKTLKALVDSNWELLFENRPDVVLLMLGENEIDNNLYSTHRLLSDYDRAIEWLRDKLNVKYIIIYEILSNRSPEVVSFDEYENRRKEINTQLATKYSKKPRIIFWKHSSVSKPYLQDLQQFDNVCKLYKNVQSALSDFVKLNESGENSMVSESCRKANDEESSLTSMVRSKFDQVLNTRTDKNITFKQSKTDEVEIHPNPDKFKVLILGHEFADFLRSLSDTMPEYDVNKNFGLANVTIEINPANTCPEMLKDFTLPSLQNLLKNSPDIVILMVGENDIDNNKFDIKTFLQNVHTLIFQLQNSFNVSFIVFCQILPRVSPAKIRQDQFQFRRMIINDLLEKEFRNSKVVMYWPHDQICKKRIQQFDKMENLKKLFESMKSAVNKSMNMVGEIIEKYCLSKELNDSASTEENNESLKSYLLWKKKYPNYINLLKGLGKKGGNVAKVFKAAVQGSFIIPEKPTKISKVSIIGYNVVGCLQEVINTENSTYEKNFGFDQFSVKLFGPGQSPSTVRELAASSLQNFFEDETEFVVIILGECDLDSSFYSLDTFRNDICEIIKKLQNAVPSIRIIIWEVLPRFDLSVVNQKTHAHRVVLANRCLNEVIAPNNDMVSYYKCKNIQKGLLYMIPLKAKVDGLYKNIRRTLNLCLGFMTSSTGSESYSQ